MRHDLRTLSLAALCLALGACGDDDDDGGGPAEGEPVVVTFPSPELAAGPDDHVVMIVDNGFDLSLPALEGKVLGCYQRVCDAAAPEPPPADFAEAKGRFLEQLAQKDTSCRLEPGASLRKSASLARLAPQKEAWNTELARKALTQQHPNFSEIARVLGGEDSYSYHGTWVASALAYQNPKAKFVVVNNEAIQRADASPRCPTPEEFELELALYRDPAVRAAYAASPYEQIGEQADALVRRFGVTIVNESFGPNPYPIMADACPGLDWQGYYELLAELGAARAEAIAATGAFDGLSVLTLVAAGNDGLTLDTPAVSLRCGSDALPDGFGPGSATALVGSYDPVSGARSAFSNAGGCVGAYAPGEGIVVTGPEGWLFVVSGTSFASPLAARALTLEQPASAGGLALRDALLAARGPEGFLPRASFPSALFYRDASSAVAAAPGVALAPRARGPGLAAPRRPSFAPPGPR